MNYEAPADRAVFDVRRASRPDQQRSDPNYVTGEFDGLPVVAYMPPAWARLDADLSGGGRSSINPSKSIWAVPAFLHRRVSAAGHERLVVAQLLVVWFEGAGASLVAESAVPGSAVRDPQMVPGPKSPDLLFLDEHVHGHLSDDLAVFAGQPDPADASHFTIEYELDHARHTVDGWLQDDDTVKLEIRPDPPVTPPPPPSPASPR